MVDPKETRNLKEWTCLGARSIDACRRNLIRRTSTRNLFLYGNGPLLLRIYSKNFGVRFTPVGSHSSSTALGTSSLVIRTLDFLEYVDSSRHKLPCDQDSGLPGMSGSSLAAGPIPCADS